MMQERTVRRIIGEAAGMSGFGAKTYAKMAVETGVAEGDPHALVLMLYDGAIAACREAFGHMKNGRLADKGEAVGKAIRIIDEGLRVSLDRSAGGQLALRLADLYEYMVMRLLQSNLRNDATGLVEVAKLLHELREAWIGIQNKRPAPGTGAPAAAAAGAPAAAAAGPPAAPAPRSRFFTSAQPGPVRPLASA